MLIILKDCMPKAVEILDIDDKEMVPFIVLSTEMKTIGPFPKRNGMIKNESIT
jgi:hypothetical protein